MEINELLNGIDCKCGRHHSCSIKYVYIESDALKRLVSICKNYNKILLVSDENTYSVCGKKALQYLDGKEIKQVVFDGKNILVPNETAIETVESCIDGADAIVGIGSGVIQDICKFVSFDKKIPYIIIATATSMDGYASTGAAMVWKGMKTTFHCGLPMAIIADTKIIAEAPMEMIKSGYGDIIGKFSALNDWKLSRIVNGEYFCDYIYNLTYEMVQKVLPLSKSLLQRDEESVKILMEALVIVGIAMSFAGNSRPASGSEHHLAHFFEIVGIEKNERYFSHGIDVAFATAITCRLRENLLKKSYDVPQFKMMAEEYKNKMNEVYGKVGIGCVELQKKVGFYDKDRASTYEMHEEEIKKVLSEAPTEKQIIEILNGIGLNIEDFYAMYGEKKINDAIMYAKDLKDRYTVLWMNYDLNGVI